MLCHLTSILQVNTECQASHFDLCNCIPAWYYVAKFSREREKLHRQCGEYFFHIPAVSYGVTEVLLVDNNLFKVTKFQTSKKLFKVSLNTLLQCNCSNYIFLILKWFLHSSFIICIHYFEHVLCQLPINNIYFSFSLPVWYKASFKVFLMLLSFT